MDNIFNHVFAQPIFLAALGGFVLNMMNLYQDQQRPKNQRTEKDVLYWVMFSFWPLAGGMLAFVYLLDGSTLRPILSFTVGITAPTTLQAMLQVTLDNNGVVEGDDVED
ncbi:MAG: hypothetical protein KUG75_01250 [Pseudomonadales bacterium]|nr:hypothetical protein [Pseudomonadales bacterium]